eukprot:CAMPEP_0175056798 /NCGR_PEP_ID=MMETSP0052_2-20121109/10886_1 /TAXON_ID=51329 ORGANISM="Polytomella parva, Strain SAG 63-3" /NCGR_SAMPLE_ID=MMETSP0052_2 /ASSEMBLY_ACC=CAM_ASM_000194 /LENGTH=345 /DNA_ID=CAMNT_0016321895 /DNA_START=132 /DNA_END=1169 /DNA_ORIENTATION=-
MKGTNLLILFVIASLQACHCVRPISVVKFESSSKAVRSDESLNSRPIIGVVTQPGDPAPEGASYVAASYVKWIESAGARVIPILYDLSELELTKRFNIINGLIIPGGGAHLSEGHKFYDTVSFLVDLAVKANDMGDFFPVHGTCLGMEALVVYFSGDCKILGTFNATNAPARLLFTNNAKTSRLFTSLPRDVVLDLQTDPIAMENHENGLSMAAYSSNAALSNFMSVTSLSVDKNNHPYVSTLEANNYPITASQWHPEKNAFEWTPLLDIPHSAAAIRMSQSVADFFVDQARHNFHHATDAVEEDALLIYNYPAVFYGKHTSTEEEADFEQIYIFNSTYPAKSTR